MSDWRQYLAECIGTFTLVFTGCGAVVVDQMHGGLGVVGISMVFGLVVLAVVYAIGDLSGAHINPAVTLGFAMAGVFPWRQLPPYVLAQAAGAILASLLLVLFFPEAASLGQTVPSGSLQQSLGMEMVLTFLLMFIIIQIATGTHEQRLLAGVSIGGAVALLAMIGGPVSGASMNPARSLGPALAAADWTAWWIYWVGPAAGAVLAIGCWRLLNPRG